MHIGVFTLRDMSLAGGGFLRVVGLSQYLVELGCQVTLFAPRFTPQLEGKVHFVPLEGQVGGLDQFSRLSLFQAAFPSLLQGLRYAPVDHTFAALINAQELDLIHCHTHSAGLRLLRIRSRLNVPVALDVHGILRLQRENGKGGLKGLLSRYLYVRAEYNLFRQIDALIVRTEAEREYVAEQYRITPERIRVVPDGADVDFLGQPVSENDKHALRAELGLSDKRVILFAGGFKAQSGVMDLVKAFPILNSRRSGVALVLIGDVTELTAQVKAFIHEQGLANVTLLGRQSREQFRIFQQMADVVVAPEIKTIYNELGAPLKLLDCLGSGRPTVATRIASHTPIIEDGVNGFLVEPQDPADIARGLERVLDDPNAAEIGRRGRQTMIEKHSWRRAAQYAVQAYADLLQQKEGRS